MSNSCSAAVDIGNTRAKIGIFCEWELVTSFTDIHEQQILELLHEHRVEKVIVSNVNKSTAVEKIKTQISKLKPLYFNHLTKLPIKINYNTPDTLGVDRIAAAVAAHFLYPRQNCLSVDCGSCITYDLLKEGKTYLGGAISPGIQMKLKALHNFTARLPLIENKNDIEVIGKTTEESILSGVVNGTVAEIEGMIQNYKNLFADLKVVLCGGDALFFDSKIKGTNFVVEDLVLIGLNQVLLYNV